MKGTDLMVGMLVRVAQRQMITHGGRGYSDTRALVEGKGRNSLPVGTILQCTRVPEKRGWSSQFKVVQLPDGKADVYLAGTSGVHKKSRMKKRRFGSSSTMYVELGDVVAYHNHACLKKHKEQSMTRAQRIEGKEKVLAKKEAKLKELNEEASQLTAECNTLRAEVEELKKFPDDAAAIAHLLMDVIRNPDATEADLAKVLRERSTTHIL